MSLLLASFFLLVWLAVAVVVAVGIGQCLYFTTGPWEHEADEGEAV